MTLAIISDQPTATALLQEIAQLCVGHGAQWHPELEVEVVQGDMRLLGPPGTTGRLISLPTDLLLPIGEAQWSRSPDALELMLRFPRFRGHRSGVHRGECTGSDARLLVVDRTHVADR